MSSQAKGPCTNVLRFWRERRQASDEARRGSRSKRICVRGVTKLQAIFGARLRVVALLTLCWVARPSQTHEGNARRCRLAGGQNPSRHEPKLLRGTALAALTSVVSRGASSTASSPEPRLRRSASTASVASLWAKVMSLAILLLVGTATRAQQVYGDFSYTVSGAAVTIIKYNGTGGIAAIPTIIPGVGVVTSVGGGAFLSAPINRVVFPDTITNIGAYAFMNCQKLTNLVLPPGLASVEKLAFSQCYSLRTLVIPEGVQTIGEGAFLQCTSLAPIIIPSSVTRILENAFANTAVTSLVIPDRVQTVGDGAFTGCRNLTNVSIPNSVTSLGTGAFGFCHKLVSVTLPPSVQSLPGGLFNYCSNLVHVAIPATVTNIGPAAFQYCPRLTNVSLPSGIPAIPDQLFMGCRSLARIVIPDNTTGIGKEAFYECSGLTNLVFGDKVASIGQNSLAGLTSLQSIDVSPANAVYSSLGGVLFDRERSRLLLYPTGRRGAYVVPRGTTALLDISMSAPWLSDVLISDTVTNIGRWTFSGCSSLTRVVIPKSVSSLGAFAFSGCSNLAAAFFEGDAPSTYGGLAFNAKPFTIYYRSGTKGWSTPTWNDYPARPYDSATAPFSVQATAVAQVVQGFVVGATLTETGFGYTNAPRVTFEGGGGAGARGTAIVSNLVVTSIRMDAPGFGYTHAPTVVLDPPSYVPSPGDQSRQASAMAQVVNGFVVGISLIDGGFGYDRAPSILLVDGGGTGARATAIMSGSSLIDIRIDDPGQGYSQAPMVVVSPPPREALPATVAAQVVNGFIVGFTVVNGGRGYDQSPIVSIIDTLGAGAVAFATVSHGSVTAVTVAKTGSGYSLSPTVNVILPTTPPRQLTVQRTASPGRIEISANVTPGNGYLWIRSADLRQWRSVDSPFVANSELVTLQLPGTNRCDLFQLVPRP